MKIFIFGSSGMLGNYIKKYLSDLNYDIVSFSRKEYDLTFLTIQSLESLLINHEIKEKDIIINCSGVIPQSSNRQKLTKDLYYKINSIFPIVLSMLCDKLNCKMIHITTDCVFNGNEGLYGEKSNHTETNDYGTSKSLGELSNSTIIRTSIIGEELYNKTSLLEWVKSNKNKEINGYTKHFWNGVTCLQLAKIIEYVIKHNLYWNGVRHIFSPNTVSKYELVSIINNVYKLNIKINKLETEKVDKSLTSIYKSFYDIPILEKQIEEQKDYI